MGKEIKKSTWIFRSFSIKNIYYNNVYIVQFLRLFAYRNISIMYIYFQRTNIYTLMIDRQESWQQIFTYLNMLKFTFNGNKKSFARIKYHTIGSEGIEKESQLTVSEWLKRRNQKMQQKNFLTTVSLTLIEDFLYFGPSYKYIVQLLTYTCTSKKSKIIFSSF